MSPGDELKLINHMLLHFQSASMIIKTELVGRLSFDIEPKITVINYAYATRNISTVGKEKLTDAGVIFFDREDMWKKIWSKAVIDYAISVHLQWIVPDTIESR